MENTILYLIGFAGTGKYTIAKEIAARTQARLVDNHLILNPVFSFIPLGEGVPIQEMVWQKAWEIRNIVLDIIENISPPEMSFIFTNQLAENDAVDTNLFEEIAALAKRRNSRFLPVRLICSEAELCKRVQQVERKARFKDTSVENAKRHLRDYVVFSPKRHEHLTLDVSNLSAPQAAEAILAQLVQK